MDAVLITLAVVLVTQAPPDAAPAAPEPSAQQAEAQADLARRTPDQPGLEVTLVAGVWVPRLGGNSSLGAGAPIDLATQLSLDSQEAVANVELSIRSRDRLTVTFSGFAFNTDSESTFHG